MRDRASQLVCDWIDAYYSQRDEEMIPLAHPEIEIRPRVGHGEKIYRGIDGVRRWLDYTRPARSPIETYSTELLPDGRVLGQATLEGLGVIALFEIRDEQVARVTMYISDREMLVKLGEIDAPPGPAEVHQITAAG